VRPALILIDLQRDYLDRPGLVPGEPELLRGVAALLEGCRGAGVPVFHAMTLVQADGANRMPHWKEAGTWACLEGTPGARPPAAVAPREGEPVLAKDFYSAFDSPGLEAGLAAGAIDTVILAGVYTHACVRATALDAYRHGYRVLIATDAIGSTDAEHARLTLGWLEGRGSHAETTDAILAGIARAGAAREAGAPGPWLHRSPANRDEVLFEVPEAGATQVASAVEGARAAGAWGETAPAERLARLSRWRDALEAARDSLVAALVRDVGKPVVEARGEFAYAMALLGSAIESFAIEESPHARTRLLVRHRPVGTVALVTPWNNPLAIAVGKLAPALAWGNTAVWKPALPGTRIALAVVDALEAAGLGEAVRLVAGGGETGRHLVRHPGIDAVSFTGSLAAGRVVAAACGAAGRPLQAELGGNNAVIVMGGIDVEATAAEVAGAAFSFSGQRCTAPRRLIVDRGIRGPFEEALVAATRSLAIGDPEMEATRIGPVISRAQQERIAALVSSPSGGRVLCGGGIPAAFAQGCWIEPAIVADPDPASILVREESFGPVAVLLEAGGIEEALALANGVEHGLVASLFSNDPRHRELFLRLAQAGMLAINQARPAFDAQAPFGGWKRSGHGPPEHGRWDREFYSRAQAVYG
jgi:acyl-CoA reductase-like NAD-dependent aldehyde dehydrogenase/nicotinamidase-related amidase